MKKRHIHQDPHTIKKNERNQRKSIEIKRFKNTSYRNTAKEYNEFYDSNHRIPEIHRMYRKQGKRQKPQKTLETVQTHNTDPKYRPQNTDPRIRTPETDPRIRDAKTGPPKRDPQNGTPRTGLRAPRPGP